MTLIDQQGDTHAKISKVKPRKNMPVTIEPTAALSPAQPLSETQMLLQMVERAGRDPNFDVDKFERLVGLVNGMKERDAANEAEAEFNAAMSQVQSQMTRIAADASNTHTKSRYATYAAFDRVLRPLYSKAGFGLSFDTEEGAPPDHIRIVCFVTHTARHGNQGLPAKRSHTRKYHVDMPADGKGAQGKDVMTKTHAAGSAYTYGQRYLLKMIFNVAIGDDDDGNKAGDTAPDGIITAEQLADIEALIKEVDADAKNVCKACHVESLADLTQVQFKKAKAKLESMRAPL